MPTFAHKCLPPELLYEIVPFIPAENAAPNALSSCSLLHKLLLSRVLKWKEKAMEERIIEIFDQFKEEMEQKLMNKLNEIKDELRLEFNQKFDALEVRVGHLERGTATNTNQGKKSLNVRERVDPIFEKLGLTRGKKSRSPEPSCSKTNTGGLENDGNSGGESEKEQTKSSNDGALPPPIPPLRSSLQGKPPPVPTRSSRTALQPVERLRAIESTESTITIAWKSHSITDVEIECYEVQYRNVHGVWSKIKCPQHAFVPKKAYTAVVKNLKPATLYALTVVALNKHGNTVDVLTMSPVATKPRFMKGSVEMGKGQMPSPSYSNFGGFGGGGRGGAYVGGGREESPEEWENELSEEEKEGQKWEKSKGAAECHFGWVAQWRQVRQQTGRERQRTAASRTKEKKADE